MCAWRVSRRERRGCARVRLAAFRACVCCGGGDCSCWLSVRCAVVRERRRLQWRPRRWSVLCACEQWCPVSACVCPVVCRVCARSASLVLPCRVPLNALRVCRCAAVCSCCAEDDGRRARGTRHSTSAQHASKRHNPHSETPTTTHDATQRASSRRRDSQSHCALHSLCPPAAPALLHRARHGTDTRQARTHTQRRRRHDAEITRQTRNGHTRARMTQEAHDKENGRRGRSKDNKAAHRMTLRKRGWKDRSPASGSLWSSPSPPLIACCLASVIMFNASWLAPSRGMPAN